MRIGACVLVVALLLPAFQSAAQVAKPSRKPSEHCAWEKFSDAALGLADWVQRCDYGKTQIDFIVDGNALTERYSDVPARDHVVQVIDLEPGESPEAGLQRFFTEHTDKALVPHCHLQDLPKNNGEVKERVGVKRYEFVADAGYAKKMLAKDAPGDMPEPLCGEWGYQPDSMSYFETHPASGVRKVLFVDLGQDEPLFDEQTLQLLPAN